MKNKQAGISILAILLLGIVLILVLGYFKISVRDIVNNPTSQDNINYVKGGSETIYDKYLAKPVHYLYQDVFIDIFWKSFINNFERIRDGQPTDFTNAAPQVNH